MLEKKGTTPKSYAKNIENSQGKTFFCYKCDRVIRESVNSDRNECPWCGEPVSECEIKIVEKSELDGESKNQHP